MIPQGSSIQFQGRYEYLVRNADTKSLVQNPVQIVEALDRDLFNQLLNSNIQLRTSKNSEFISDEQGTRAIQYTSDKYGPTIEEINTLWFNYVRPPIIAAMNLPPGYTGAFPTDEQEEAMQRAHAAFVKQDIKLHSPIPIEVEVREANGKYTITKFNIKA